MDINFNLVNEKVTAVFKYKLYVTMNLLSKLVSGRVYKFIYCS